jgi:hypothetical protein
MWHGQGRVGVKRATFHITTADNVLNVLSTEGCTITLTIPELSPDDDRLDIEEESIVCKLSGGKLLRCTGYIEEGKIRVDAHMDEQENYAWFWFELIEHERNAS